MAGIAWPASHVSHRTDDEQCVDPEPLQTSAPARAPPTKKGRRTCAGLR